MASCFGLCHISQSRGADPCLLIHDGRPAELATDPPPDPHTEVRDLKVEKHLYSVKTACSFGNSYWLKTNLRSINHSVHCASACMFPNHHWGDWNDSQLQPTIQKLMKGYNRYLRPNFNGRKEPENWLVHVRCFSLVLRLQEKCSHHLCACVSPNWKWNYSLW